jgi:hypothetical protein
MEAHFRVCRQKVVYHPFASAGSKFTFLKTWSKATADERRWIDQNFGAYQSVNLLTQRDGQLFLVGFHRSGDWDWMDLYSVDLRAPAATMLTNRQETHVLHGRVQLP